MADGYEHARRAVTLVPEHRRYLEKLKAEGFEPRVIYDIGSCVCHFADVARELWPHATIVLFDALPRVEKYYVEAGYEHYHIGVLTDADGRRVRFYASDVHPGGSSYYREVGSPVSDTCFREEDGLDTQGMTLDSVVRDRGFPPPDLVKIDVQGCEQDVMRGGLSALRNASVLIVEMQHTRYNEGAPLVTETLPFIQSLGFECVAARFAENPCDADYAFRRRDGGVSGVPLGGTIT